MHSTLRKPVLKTAARQWLKSIHLILGATWLGAGVSMIVLRLAWVPSVQSDPYTLNQAVALINDWIIIPVALASVLVGILESWLTPWGFFKHRWVTVKWIVTLAIIISSPVFTSPWDRAMETISKAEGLAALQNTEYLQYQSLVTITGISKVAALVALTVISILKPWK